MNKNNKENISKHQKNSGLIVGISSIVLGAGLLYGLNTYFTNIDNRIDEQTKIEQSLHPKVLNYERTDSVQIQRYIMRNNLNYKPSKKDIDVIYVKKSDNEHSDDYELTTLYAQNGKVYKIDQDFHVFKDMGIRPQSHERMDLSNHREIYTGGPLTYNGFSSIRYQKEYEYYKNKLDSLEDVFRKKKD